MKHFLDIILFLFCCQICSYAQKYEVLYVNSDNIIIGTKSVTKGLIFDGTDKIVWSSDNQAIKVLNKETQKISVIAAKECNKRNATSVFDYFTRVKHLSTRSFSNIAPKTDDTLYLLDSIKVSTVFSSGTDCLYTIKKSWE